MADSKRICSVDGCGKPKRARGWCVKHHRRWLSTGDPTGLKVPKTKVWIEQALDYLGDDCLDWPFASGKGGYGNIRWEGSYTNAHRVVCILAYGTGGDNDEVAHNCGNRLCCNPAHLRWATASENNTDKLRHGTLVRGEDVPGSKLKAADVIEIRASTQKNAVLANVFGVTVSAIESIKAKKSWAWLEE